MDQEVMLSPRLQLRVAQKQILTPGLVQMVTVLQLNRLELKDMITAGDRGKSRSRGVGRRRRGANARRSPRAPGIGACLGPSRPDHSGSSQRRQRWAGVGVRTRTPGSAHGLDGRRAWPCQLRPRKFPKSKPVEPKTEKDPFDEIDFGSFFDDYLDPGYKSPSSESVEKPSFETFLSSPVTLADHLHSQLSVLVMSEDVRDAAANIIGNLDDNGYLTRVGGRDRRIGRPHASKKRAKRCASCNRWIRRGSRRRTFANACCCNWRAATAKAASRGRSSRTI